MKDRLIEIEFMTDRDKMIFETRKVNIVVALNNIFEQLNLLISNRAKNPISFLMLTLFNIELNFHWSFKMVNENCRRARQYCYDYVSERKSGKAKSQVHGVDMLSLFMESPDIFTDDFIVNELMDFFFAGTLTTQYTSQTMLTHFCHKPESLQKAREQFKKVAEELEPDKTYSNEQSYLDEVVNLDLIGDLEHLSHVVNEALRFDSPASIQTPVTLSEDCKLGDYEFKKGDIVTNMFYGLHMNEAEWQRPYEFIPERFDAESDLSLTPEGKKRNAASFAPFSGGMRICLGKNFAENNLKVLSSYLTQIFNCEHVDKKLQEGEFRYAHFFQSDARPTLVNLTLNK